MNTKFTAGPWRVFTTTGGNKLVGVGEQTGEGITDCGFGLWGGGDAEAIANAHLIAAAPDLYEALVPLLMRWADPLSIQEHHWNAARDALKKARGET